MIMEFFGKMAAKKLKAAFDDFVETADLDKNGVVDKVQAHALFDRLGEDIAKIDKAIDEAVLVEVAGDVIKSVKDVQEYLKKAQVTIAEMDPDKKK